MARANKDRHWDQNPNWVGDAAKYYTRHNRVKNYRGSASLQKCDRCDRQAYSWAQLHDTDGLDIYNHYIPLCGSCHLRYDRVGDRNGHSGRSVYASGERSGSAKLTNDSVIEIRARYIDGEARTVLAKEYKVTWPTIWALLTRRTWKNVVCSSCKSQNHDGCPAVLRNLPTLCDCGHVIPEEETAKALSRLCRQRPVPAMPAGAVP